MKKGIFALILFLGLYFQGESRAAQPDSVPIIKRLLDTDIPVNTRLRYLNKLSAAYWTVDPDSSLYYGWKGLPLLKQPVSKKHAGTLHFVLGMAWENKGSFDSAFWYLNKAAAIYSEAGERRLYFRAIEQIGSLYRIAGQYDTAIVMMNNALAYFRETDNQFQIMSTLFNIGSVYLEQNRYNKALEYYLASSAYDSILKEPDAKATHLLGVGTVYLNLADLFTTFNPGKAKQYFEMAHDNFLECHNLFRDLNHNTGLCFTSGSLLSVYMGMGEYTRADSLLNADSLCRNFPDPRVQSGFLFSEAAMMAQKGRKNEALDKLVILNNGRNQMMVLPEFHEGMLLFAKLLREKRENDSALRITVRSLTWAKENSVYPLAFNALTLLSEWMLEDGQVGKALQFMKEEMKYKDSLFSVIGHEIFDETEMKFRSRLLQAEVVQLRAEKLIEKFRLRVFILGAIVILLILSLITLWFIIKHRKARKKQEEAELRADNENKEKLLREKELENLRLEMQIKEQELVFHTLQGLDLSKLTRSMSDKLQPFQIRFPKKRDQEDFAQVLSEIKRDSDKDPLHDFEAHFRQMHGNYYEKLLRQCPDLTRSELQVCALLRLNLTTKDIARLVNLTVSSIDVVRSKIRKKLGLDQSQSLTSYLIMLG